MVALIMVSPERGVGLDAWLDACIVSAAGEGTEADKCDTSVFTMRGIRDLFSIYECEWINSRNGAALQAKKSWGERIGYVPFGFRLATDGIPLEHDPKEQDILQQMRELRAEGLFSPQNSHCLNEKGAFNKGDAQWHHMSVNRLMKMVA